MIVCKECWARKSVSGTITDTNGALIAGATVTITTPNFTAAGKTDSAGIYTILDPPPGPYTITVEAEGFETSTGTVGASTLEENYYYSALKPKPANDSEIVIFTITDAATGRPQHLPLNGLWPGELVDLTGLFRVLGTVEADGAPYPRELNGLQVVFTNGAGRYPASIASAGPNRIRIVVPDDLPPGPYDVTVDNGVSPSRTAKVRVRGPDDGPGPPATFTRNGLGFGAADATNEAGEPITFINPARPGSAVDIKVVRQAGVTGFQGNFPFRGGVPMLVQQGSADSGIVTVRMIIPDGLTQPQTGCATPFQISVTDENGQTRLGNQVTLPISLAGPCSDDLGFGPSDITRLNAGDLKIVETFITEATSLSTARVDRILARLQATRWDSSSYAGVAPVDTCSYRWESFPVTNAFAPARLDLGGTASTTVPWGLFTFSPASNAGPFSLVFAPPPSVTEGNYSVNFPAGFTVGGVPFAFQASGPYTRPAGRLRDFVAARAAEASWRDGGLSSYLDGVIESIINAPPADKAQVFADFNIVADNGTLGRDQIRCVVDPAKLSVGILGGIPTNSLFIQNIPERTNSTSLTVRFIPRVGVRHEHANSGADRSHLTLDSLVTFPNLNGNR